MTSNRKYFQNIIFNTFRFFRRNIFYIGFFFFLVNTVFFISSCEDNNESSESDKLEISLSVNGECRQKSKSDRMIWSINEIIYLLSQTVPLVAGDLIYTGTPSGVGKIEKGDTISAILLQENSTELSFQIS